MPDKKWQSATVIYTGGVSYHAYGYVFKNGRPTHVTSEKVATKLRGRKGFSVEDRFEGEARKATPVKKKKKVAKKKPS